MNREQNLIRMIDELMPGGDGRVTKCFESDSEVLKFKGDKLLFSTDEFSTEDLFRENNPYVLGWNIAVAGISDILASGGKPLYYAHALVIKETWDDNFIRKFTKGIAEVLRKMNIVFIGGDFGISNDWRYIVSVIGEPVSVPITRQGTRAGDLIFMTGKVGLGNIEAGLNMFGDRKNISNVTNLFKNKFNIRIEEAKLIAKFANVCIDTSDGLFNALNAISELNATGYIIENIPYLKKGVALSRILTVPKTLLFLGESGEYELLFTIRENDKKYLLNSAKKARLKFTELGRITSAENRILVEDDRELDLTGINFRARDFKNKKEYLNQLVNYIS